MRAGISSDKSSSSSSAMRLALCRFRQMPPARQPGGAAGFGELADAQDVGLPLGHADDAARIQQVEQMACLEALVVGWQRQLRSDQIAAFRLDAGEVPEPDDGRRAIEAVRRILGLRLMADLAVRPPATGRDESK